MTWTDQFIIVLGSDLFLPFSVALDIFLQNLCWFPQAFEAIASSSDGTQISIVLGVSCPHFHRKISHYQLPTGYFSKEVFSQRKGISYLAHASYSELQNGRKGKKFKLGKDAIWKKLVELTQKLLNFITLYSFLRTLFAPTRGRVQSLSTSKSFCKKLYDHVLKVFGRFEEKLPFLHKSVRFRPKGSGSKGNFMRHTTRSDHHHWSL